MNLRARTLRIVWAAAALLFAAASARADGVVDAKVLAGAHDQFSEGLDAVYATASGTVAGVGGSFFSDKQYVRTVSEGRASLYRDIGEGTYGLRGYYTPETLGSKAYGGTLFTQQGTGEQSQPHEGLWGLNASWIEQTARAFTAAPGLPDKTFGEGVAEFISRQNYYNAFHFQLTGSYFVYDHDLNGIRAYRTVQLQDDIANLGTMLALAEPPRWNASLQYARVVGGGTDGAWNLVLAYSRIGLLVDSRFLNSYMAGVQFPLPDGVHAELGYNAVEGNASTFASYGGLTLTYYWH